MIGSTRDAEATKARLIAAGMDEFATHGIAGARVDRIARQARSNKAQIYHYFGSKDGLFDAVFAEIVALVLAEAPLDAANMPEYAGRLFDGYVAHPQIARLATWYRLERGTDQRLLPAVIDANSAKVDAIAAAQTAGRLTAEYSPEILLGIVIHMAALWASQTPEYDHLLRDLDTRKRRDVVVTAVEKLTTPSEFRTRT